MYWSAISSGLKSSCNNEIHSVTLSYVYIFLINAVNGDIFAYSNACKWFLAHIQLMVTRKIMAEL